MIPTKFRFIWPSGLRGEDLKIGQSETRIACGSHVWKWIIRKCALFRGHSIDASYLASAHFAEVFRGED